MGDKNVGRVMTDKLRETWLPKLLKLAKEKACCKAVMEEMEDAIQDNSVNISGKYFLPVPVMSPRFSSKTCNTQPSSLAL